MQIAGGTRLQQHKGNYSSRVLKSYTHLDKVSSSCRRLVSCPASNHETRYKWRERGLAEGDLDFCLSEVQRAAAPDSKWAAGNEQAFRKVAAAVGGSYLLVQCGQWPEGHQLAGQPVLALAHILCATVLTEPIPRSKKLRYLPPQRLDKPEPEAPDQQYVVGAFQLDAQGWPTGESDAWVRGHDIWRF
jgi:hypothetical protein